MNETTNVGGGFQPAIFAMLLSHRDPKHSHLRYHPSAVVAPEWRFAALVYGEDGLLSPFFPFQLPIFLIKNRLKEMLFLRLQIRPLINSSSTSLRHCAIKKTFRPKHYEIISYNNFYSRKGADDEKEKDSSHFVLISFLIELYYGRKRLR